MLLCYKPSKYLTLVLNKHYYLTAQDATPLPSTSNAFPGKTHPLLCASVLHLCKIGKYKIFPKWLAENKAHKEASFPVPKG